MVKKNETIPVLDSKEFKEFIDSKDLVVVDFFATWCGPCKMLSPILEELSKELEGEFKFAKVDVDENFELAKTYGIMSVPSILLFKDNKLMDKIVGLTSKNQILEVLFKNK